MDGLPYSPHDSYCRPGPVYTSIVHTHCNTPQHAATQCNTLQHTATHIHLLLEFVRLVTEMFEFVRLVTETSFPGWARAETGGDDRGVFKL